MSVCVEDMLRLPVIGVVASAGRKGEREPSRAGETVMNFFPSAASGPSSLRREGRLCAS